jgi:hypothetical protein
MSTIQTLAMDVDSVDIGVGCSGRPWVLSTEGVSGALRARRFASDGEWDAPVELASTGYGRIAVHNDDVGHVAFRSGVVREERISYTTTAGGTPVPVETTGSPGSSFAIDVTPDGLPRLVFTSGPSVLARSNRSVMFAEQRSPGIWRSEIVSSRFEGTIAMVSLTHGADGRPRVLFSNETDTYELYEIVLAERGASWTERVVATGVVDGPRERLGYQGVAVEMDRDGVLQVALGSDQNTSFVSGAGYAMTVSPTGVAGALEPLTDDTTPVTHVDIALDADDDPHVLVVSDYELVYATRSSGGPWTFRTVDTYPAGGGAIAVDPFGGVHIVWIRGSERELAYVRYID